MEIKISHIYCSSIKKYVIKKPIIILLMQKAKRDYVNEVVCYRSEALATKFVFNTILNTLLM